MANRIKFHLDENISYSIALGLRHRSLDVTTTPETGLLGVSDQEQLQFAGSEGRVIFTQDTDFLKLAQSSPDHTGIAYCSQRNKSIDQVIQGLVLMWEILEPEEMCNHIEFL
ncbi:slr0771 [Synechocystis sp. PCC 6803]|uniref:Slr0771 protein n=1 Tax=Synechocystis sp. (strain ATCC 27184 / PCC 6803 / Kazusa) TaxID=1111708 RepID=Q55606_SYNY3|nr:MULTISPECIES: DUF5615 family PIN-like protein [unclassified Synechocystis]BAM54547.1 hypothetical protein BEST7613_5616 [Synechocystis sp. PCC 6803] [Bacillus subtilis BEST7613]AGF52408.1 hypothetical protein MYO_121690 [Synechocystis sp. PCC 6803]ALJ68346.1 hypothetical protein AOY38_11175 [Synechocystis sp. PCC 6803]AVP90187.1 hypothetical protein C7I86_11225 [Synechocystis sp. IPPAS B-1465]MBD2619155.1 DUF5615 family PIN-like protein [Synechocystis sp. FACHB-898]